MIHASVSLTFGKRKSVCPDEGNYKITSYKTSPFFMHIWSFKKSCLKLKAFHGRTEYESNFCLPETQSEYDKLFFDNPQPDTLHPEIGPYPRY